MQLVYVAEANGRALFQPTWHEEKKERASEKTVGWFPLSWPKQSLLLSLLSKRPPLELSDLAWAIGEVREREEWGGGGGRRRRRRRRRDGGSSSQQPAASSQQPAASS